MILWSWLFGGFDGWPVFGGIVVLDAIFVSLVVTVVAYVMTKKAR